MFSPKKIEFSQPDFSSKKIFNKLDFLFSSLNNNPLNEYHQTNQEWSNLQGCYGAYLGNPETLRIPLLTDPWKLISSVLYESSFSGQGYRSLEISEGIINQKARNNKRYTMTSPNGDMEIVRLYNINTGTYIENTINALIYILESLKMGVPIICGVNCQQNALMNNSDESTDHYIVIVGCGNDARNYLLGWDIACLLISGEINTNEALKEGIAPANKIYLDIDWPGLLASTNPWPNYYSQARQPYKLTQVFRTFEL